MSATAFPVAEAAASTAAKPSTGAARPRSSIRLWPRLVHVQRPTAHIRTIQRGYRPLRLTLIRHLHKRKAPRPAGLTIGHDAHALHRAICFEERSNRFLTNAEIEVANKNIFQVFSLAI